MTSSTRSASRPTPARWLPGLAAPFELRPPRWLARDDLARRSAAPEPSQDDAAAAFAAAGTAMVITDAALCIVAVNPAFTTATGFEPVQVVGLPLWRAVSAPADDPLPAILDDALARCGQWQGEVLQHRREGPAFAAWMAVGTQFDDDDRVRRHVATFFDIGPLRRETQALHDLARHDALTGLPNRLMFESELTRCIQRARRRGQGLALLFVDLDHFKGINETLGHDVGDQVLQQVAQRLRTTVRGEDALARLGGDQFTIVLEDLVDGPAAGRLADKLQAAIRRRFELAGQHIRLSASIGVAFYPADAAAADDLLRAADAAMNRAKRLGGGAVALRAPVPQGGTRTAADDDDPAPRG